jgi:hypothetical protein
MFDSNRPANMAAPGPVLYLNCWWRKQRRVEMLTRLLPRHAEQRGIVDACAQCQSRALALPKAEPYVGAKREVHEGNDVLST